MDWSTAPRANHEGTYTCGKVERRDASRARESKAVWGTLEESDFRYRLLLEAAGDFVFLHELAAEDTPGHFTEVSQSACRRLGCAEEELRALGPLDIIADADREHVPSEASELVGDT